MKHLFMCFILLAAAAYPLSHFFLGSENSVSGSTTDNVIERRLRENLQKIAVLMEASYESAAEREREVKTIRVSSDKFSERLSAQNNLKIRWPQAVSEIDKYLELMQKEISKEEQRSTIRTSISNRAHTLSDLAERVAKHEDGGALASEIYGVTVTIADIISSDPISDRDESAAQIDAVEESLKSIARNIRSRKFQSDRYLESKLLETARMVDALKEYLSINFSSGDVFSQHSKTLVSIIKNDEAGPGQSARKQWMDIGVMSWQGLLPILGLLYYLFIIFPTHRNVIESKREATALNIRQGETIDSVAKVSNEISNGNLAVHMNESNNEVSKEIISDINKIVTTFRELIIVVSSVTKSVVSTYEHAKKSLEVSTAAQHSIASSTEDANTEANSIADFAAQVEVMADTATKNAASLKGILHEGVDAARSSSQNSGKVVDHQNQIATLITRILKQMELLSGVVNSAQEIDKVMKSMAFNLELTADSTTDEDTRKAILEQHKELTEKQFIIAKQVQSIMKTTKGVSQNIDLVDKRVQESLQITEENDKLIQTHAKRSEESLASIANVELSAEELSSEARTLTEKISTIVSHMSALTRLNHQSNEANEELISAVAEVEETTQQLITSINHFRVGE